MVGAFDVIAPVEVKAVEAQRFREAMSLYGAAVHVITTDGPGGKTGLTATAVSSVSDNPPTLLVCINRRSQAAPMLSMNGVFCVNTLRSGDEAVADTFAGRTGAVLADRFKVGEWKKLTTGAPVLSTAIVSCDCRVIEITAMASHNVIFAVVEAISFGPAAPALVYPGRSYKTV
jgi:flavin reductase (DIM6/NTAB) family NADH-FMN oxidoreductase RutF